MNRSAFWKVIAVELLLLSIEASEQVPGMGFSSSREQYDEVMVKVSRLFSRSDLPGRPQTRADCVDGPRPCPWVGCRYNLFLDVRPGTGNIQFNFKGLDLDELPATCALDIADEGGKSLDAVGDLVNLTRERIRQIENMGIEIIRDQVEGPAHG